MITFGDVLEHLRDPLAVLRMARPKLKPTGFVVTSVPNVAHGDVRLSLLHGEFQYRKTGLLDQTHIHFFTLQSVRELLFDSGLTVVDTRRVIMPMFATELGLDPDNFSDAVLEEIRADTEYESYQFVMKSVLDTGSQAVAEMAHRCEELAKEVRGLPSRNERLQKDLVGFDEMHEENTRISGEMQRYSDHIENLTRQVHELHDELNSVERRRIALEDADVSRSTRRSTRPRTRWSGFSAHMTRSSGLGRIGSPLPYAGSAACSAVVAGSEGRRRLSHSTTTPGLNCWSLTFREGTVVESFEVNENSDVYYSGSYWNDLEPVRERINRWISGDGGTTWHQHFASKTGRVFKRALILNCGNGWVERELHEQGLIEEAVGIDYSEALLDEAREAARSAGLPLSYQQANINTATLPDLEFDLVVNHAAAHHITAIDRVFRQVCQILPEDGWFVSFDYVGPHRNQYRLDAWEEVWTLNRKLPLSLSRSLYTLR